MIVLADEIKIPPMLPNLLTLAERVRWARNNKGLSQDGLAQAINRKFSLGISQGAVDKVEGAKTAKPKFLNEAAEVLGVPYEWLARGEISYDQRPNAENIDPKDTVPVYGYASGAGSCLRLNDSAIVERLPRNNPNMGNDGFYLLVAGDSMEPRYEHGERLAVSKKLPPRKGRDVVVLMNDGTAVVKRLINISDDEIEVKQFNPEKKLKYSMSDVAGIFAIVGHEF